jgi:hypothetical protein
MKTRRAGSFIDRRRTRLAASLALVLAGAGCERELRVPVDGWWVSSAGGHWRYNYMHLTQVGDKIWGKLFTVSSGHVVTRDVPVGGSYPSVWFTTKSSLHTPKSCCASATYVGEVNGDKQFIDGRYEYSDGTRSEPFFFTRTPEPDELKGEFPSGG